MLDLHASADYLIVGPTDHSGWMAPLGGVERALGKVRFARLMHRRGRVLGGSADGTACGADSMATASLLRVVWRSPLRRRDHERAYDRVLAICR
jgi:hypothetical protein